MLASDRKENRARGRPPGLTGLPFLGNLLDFSRDVLSCYDDWSQRYGDVVALHLGAWPAVLLSHPDHVEYVLARGPHNFIKFPFFFRHVRAIFAVKDQRELLAVSNAQDDERGQPFGIGADGTDVDAFPFKLLGYETSHVVGTDTGDECALQSKPGQADCRVGRAPADIFGERAHVLKPSSGLLPVEVDA